MGEPEHVKERRPEPLADPTSIADGITEFAILEPGSYRLVASSERGRSEQAVVIDNSSARSIDLALEPVGQIELAVHAPPGFEKEARQISIGLRLTGPGDHETLWQAVDSDQPRKALDFSNLLPGTYWLRTLTTESLCVESATLVGQEVLHRTVTVTPGMTVRLDTTLSTHCATIEGRVVSQNQPAALAHVAVLLSGTAKSPGDVFLLSAGKDGSFSLPGLPPGNYLVWAWRRDNPAYPGPANLGEVEALATPVTAAADRPAQTGAVRVLEDLGAK
jgi:hypothetical protein